MFFYAYISGLILAISLTIQTTNAVDIDNFVNLADEKVLKPLLAPQFQTDEYLESALNVAKGGFEAKCRGVAGENKYGYVFPIHPELLKKMMPSVAKKTVLEIGGASGENSILLSFAGAKHVYVNDIDATEIKQFEATKKKLPVKIQSHLESIHCNIFDVLEHKPDLSVDIVLCRNVLHFFKDQQIEEFFTLLKKILTPQGQVIFTVNSAYQRGIIDIVTIYPEITRFSWTQLLLADQDKGGLTSFYSDVSNCNEDSDPLVYIRTDTHLKERNKKWQLTGAYHKLDDTIKREIMTLILKPEQQEAMDSVDCGRIFLVENTVRAYTEENLKTLFEKKGFTVETTFALNPNNGHIYPNKKWEMGAQVGLIGRL